MKKKTIFFILVGLIILTYGVIHHFKADIKTTNSTLTIQKGDIAEKVVAVGTIVPRHTVSVKSIIPGIVGNLYHEEGDFVEQGTLLMQVAPSPTPQSVAEAYAMVKEHIAIVKQAEDHQKRLKKLAKLKFETPDQLEMTNKELHTAKARLEMAEQKLALLQKGEATIGGQNIKTTISSPISGYILQRSVDVGDPVVPLTEAQAGTGLFVIANMTDLIFKGSVNEIDVAKISPQMTAEISVAALPEVKITGSLNKVSLRSNNQDSKENKTESSPFNVGFNVELNHLNVPKSFKLRAGFSATAEIITKEAKNVVIIPERLLTFKDKKVFVDVPDPKRPHESKELEIKIGLSDGINAEVLAGLKAGDQVIDKSMT